MFFRFGSALVLIVLVSLAGATLETARLSLSREVTRQQYRLNVLLEQEARLRSQTEQLAAPVRTFQSIQRAELQLGRPVRSSQPGPGPGQFHRWRNPAQSRTGETDDSHGEVVGL